MLYIGICFGDKGSIQSSGLNYSRGSRSSVGSRATFIVGDRATSR
jgi:hypothetical protein